jgi:hypothetical protein
MPKPKPAKPRVKRTKSRRVAWGVWFSAFTDPYFAGLYVGPAWCVYAFETRGGARRAIDSPEFDGCRYMKPVVRRIGWLEVA